ncbi:GspH/FimT family protein [Pseudomonas sp. LRF_L74]|uniref:GspH/FimT family protein n=1 Tax=Pseudomonas sp. LRF_L74 TaxID=3369422 RepID=UPI003F643C88
MDRNQYRAFSLVELLVVLLVLSIALCISLPNLQSLIHSSLSQSTHDKLKASLHFARAYSIQHQINVELCGSQHGERCEGSWQHGWLIRERSSAKVIQIIRIKDDLRLTWNGFSKPVGFKPSGHSSISNGTFTLCDEHGQALWNIVLNRQGRARTVAASHLNSKASSACRGS